MFETSMVMSIFNFCFSFNYFPLIIFFLNFFSEELLNNFSSQQGAWQQCFYFLGHTRNEYVLMYTLSVFEVSAGQIGVNARE